SPSSGFSPRRRADRGLFHAASVPDMASKPKTKRKTRAPKRARKKVAPKRKKAAQKVAPRGRAAAAQKTGAKASKAKGRARPRKVARTTTAPVAVPYYITTAISYPNGPPHIGHAYEAIATDAIARFMRLDGRDVFFLTGTDAHGIKMLQTAAKEDVTPRQLV